MKEYKYTINGNKYTVGIGDIEDGIAQVEVNGVPYKVEMEKKAVSVAAVSAPKPAAAPRQNPPQPRPPHLQPQEASRLCRPCPAW